MAAILQFVRNDRGWLILSPVEGEHFVRLGRYTTETLDEKFTGMKYIELQLPVKTRGLTDDILEMQCMSRVCYTTLLWKGTKKAILFPNFQNTFPYDQAIRVRVVKTSPTYEVKL